MGKTYSQLYYQKNKKRLNAKNALWAKNNPSARKKIVLKYINKNKEKLTKKAIAYRLKNKQAIQKRRRDYYYRTNERARKQAQFEERKNILIKLLGGKCKDCKLKFPSIVYDFHHRNPKHKIDQVPNLIKSSSFNVAIKEAKKCDLLCANCHRIRHSK